MSRSVERRLELMIYGRMLGPLPAEALTEECFRCGKPTVRRKPRRACGTCVVDSRRGRGGRQAT